MPGPGTVSQAIGRIRPVRSQLSAATASTPGQAIVYNGQGAGIFLFAPLRAAVLTGLGYSFADVNGIYSAALGASGTAISFIARIVVINGDYPPGAFGFQHTTDLTGYDVLYDGYVQDVGPTIMPLGLGKIQSDDGVGLTAMLSMVGFTIPVNETLPAGIQMQGVLSNTGGGSGGGFSGTGASSSTAAASSQRGTGNEPHKPGQ